MVGIFGGLFGGRATTDDTEELTHLKNGVEAVNNAVDLQARMRSSHISAIEDDLLEARKKARKDRKALHEAREAIEQYQATVAKLERDNRKLLNLARQLIVARQVMAEVGSSHNPSFKEACSKRFEDFKADEVMQASVDEELNRRVDVALS